MDLKVNDVVIIDEIPDKELNFLSGRLGIITQVLNSPARKSRGLYRESCRLRGRVRARVVHRYSVR